MTPLDEADKRGFHDRLASYLRNPEGELALVYEAGTDDRLAVAIPMVVLGGVAGLVGLRGLLLVARRRRRRPAAAARRPTLAGAGRYRR